MQDIMYPFILSDRFVHAVDRMAAPDVAHALVREMVDLQILLPIDVELANYRIRSKTEADFILNVLNSPYHRYNALNRIQSHNQTWQEFTYVPSNLGRGYIFSFVCNNCSRSVRYLYKRISIGEYRCQHCSGMKYLSRY